MSIEPLLAAIDRYVEIKKEMKVERAGVCDDWDCGIAVELNDQFISPEHHSRLEDAKAALESALSQYVDSRIASMLKK